MLLLLGISCIKFLDCKHVVWVLPVVLVADFLPLWNLILLVIRVMLISLIVRVRVLLLVTLSLVLI